MADSFIDNIRHNQPEPFKRFYDILTGYKSEQRFRKLPEDRNKSVNIDLTSNDYLGLGERWKEFEQTFREKFPSASYSSSASRLLSRRQKDHEELESFLGKLYNKDVLLFNSGYHANVGVIQALNIPGTVFLCDKLIHASMIDGLTLANADYRRWKHNDITALEKLLTRYHDQERCIVIVESIYSMDGDMAPLDQLIALKHKYPNVILYVDEAHAFGVRGKQGLGVAEELGLIDDIDIIIGTFGKAAASAGAFAATSKLLKDFLLNNARSFIFSTALAPVNIAWTHHLMHEIIKMEDERNHLIRISNRFRIGLEDITGQTILSESQIIPLIIGDAEKAVNLSRKLTIDGIDSLPIRRPTVAAGTERIRFSLSATLTDEQIDRILEIIRKELNEI